MSWEYENALRELAVELAPEEHEVERAFAPRPPERRVPWRAVLAAAAVLIAAVAGLATLQEEPRAELARLPSSLPGDGRWAAAAEGVQVRSLGDGTFGWRDGEPEVRWESGRVEVEVAPGRGIDLSVHTSEATVRVVGTLFAVDRDSFGTAVEVERGRVEVQCTDGTSATLAAGERLHCLRSAASGLGWVLAHADAPAEERLAVLERAAARPAEPAVRSELLGLRVEVLAELGRNEAALGLAEAALEAGELAPEVLPTAVRLAGGRCARGRPFLEALVAREDPVAMTLLADCTDEVPAARALLERAREVGGDPTGAIEERLRQLE